MLNQFKICSILILGIVSIIPTAFAYDESELNLTWQTTTDFGSVAADTDGDKILDALYEIDSLSGTITFNKVIGNGVSSASITLPTGSVYELRIIDENVYIGTGTTSGNDCIATMNRLNLLTGVANTVSFFTNYYNEWTTNCLGKLFRLFMTQNQL